MRHLPIVSFAFVCCLLCVACSSRPRGTGTDRPTGDGGSADDAAAGDGGSGHDGGTLGHDAGTLGHDGGATTGDAGAPRDAGPPGSPAHIEIYSGDGIMTVEGFPGGDDMKVIVTDAAGSPVAGVTVTYTVTMGGMGVTGDGFPTGTTGTVMTDATGIARAGIRGEFYSSMESAVPSTITASCAAGSVEFHAFSTYTPPGAIPTMPETYIMTPDSVDFGTMARGSVRAGGVVGICVHMNGIEMGHGLAGLGMRFIASDDSTADTVPVVSCVNATEGLRAGGIVFTDASGTVTCDMQAPSTPGNYSIEIFVGGALRFGPFALNVT